MIPDLYGRAFAALAYGRIDELAAVLEDARTRGERAGLIVATLLCRADLSPYRVERLGLRCRYESLALALRDASRPEDAASRTERARSIQLGLLHDYAALVLRACGSTWPTGIAPGTVAFALAKVVTAPCD